MNANEARINELSKLVIGRAPAVANMLGLPAGRRA